MKNVVVLLNETGPETLSDNRLFAELTPEVAGRLLDFMLDHNVSELFPVDNRYELALFSYSKSQVDRLKMRLGDAFRYEWASVDSAGGLLDILADRFTGYDNLLILKSSSYGWEEHALAEIFSRLTECDGISAASGREDIYLLAMRLVDLPGLAHMKALTQSSVSISIPCPGNRLRKTLMTWAGYGKRSGRNPVWPARLMPLLYRQRSMLNPTTTSSLCFR